MIYLRPFRFFKRAITNFVYLPTYAAYGAGGFLWTIYLCEWKRFGQYIPIWNQRFLNNGDGGGEEREEEEVPQEE